MTASEDPRLAPRPRARRQVHSSERIQPPSTAMLCAVM